MYDAMYKKVRQKENARLLAEALEAICRKRRDAKG